MLLKRFYDEKLAQASYLVGCPASGEALVVDPNRHLDPYLRAAREEGLRITHVTETHIHADFVSGARELAHRSGALLHLSAAGGSEWRYDYAAEAGAELVEEGSCFAVGKVEISAMHTPGHTPEHMTFLVTDTAVAGEPMGAFTGDFLFVGDVGRPDLLERSVRMGGTMEAGARQLFGSLQRFRRLPEFLQIWPGHGAGSACGKTLSAVPQSTLGYELRVNWAFTIEDEDEFIRAVLAGQPDPPRYFAQMKLVNRRGPRLLEAGRLLPRLDAEGLAAALDQGSVVLDTRPAAEYARAALPGTVNIPMGRAFTTWAGWLLPYDRDFHLIVDHRRPEALTEATRDLAGIGLDRLAGYATADVVEASRAGGREIQATRSVQAKDLELEMRAGQVTLLDVRSEGEWTAGHLSGSLNVPLGELDDRLGEIPRNRPIVVHCQTGSRASIAVSLLRARGYGDVRLYPGGFADWLAGGHPVEQEAA